MVVETLRQQFSPRGNELAWQHQLQTRTQRSGEQLVQYAGALRVLADKAYPSWSSERRQEVLRNQFIQGVPVAICSISRNARYACYAR